MARPLRIIFQDAWYHVMNRGAAKKNIFHTDGDRKLFLKLLERVHERFKIEVHAYCLMDNHYHLLIRTPLPNLSQAIKYLNGLYVQKHNALNQIDGPLFRGRFKSIVVEDDEYLMHLSRYIHLNPVAANLCQAPWEYPWSSCKDYFTKKHKKSWLNVNYILSMFKTSNVTKQYQHYLDFLTDDINDETIEKIKDSLPIIGSTNFICKIANEYIFGEQKSDDMPDEKLLRNVLLPTFDGIVKSICSYYSIHKNAIFFSHRGKPSLYRDIGIYLGIEIGNMTLRELADKFKEIKATSISLIYRKMRTKIIENENLKADIDQISANLSKIEM